MDALRDRLRGAPATTALVGVALAAAAWPVITSLPGIGLDGSFVTGLHLAFRNGLDYGEQIVYAYGPLGFLGFPQPYFGASSAFASVATGLLVVATCITLASAGARLAGPLVGAAVAFPAAHLMAWTGMWEVFGSLAILWTLTWLLEEEEEAPAVYRRIAVLGAMAAIGILGKFNVGVLLVGTGVIAAVAMPKNRPLGLVAFGLGLAGLLTLAWILTGQELGALGAYLRLSAEVAAGYSSAMGAQELEPLVWQLGLAVAAVGLLSEMLYRASAGLQGPRRLGLAIVLAAYAFAYFKAGFVRWDAHVIIFFASVPLVAFAFLRSTPSPIGSILRLGCMLAALLVVAGAPPTRLISMGPATEQLIDQVATIMSPAARRDRVSAALNHLQTQYGLAPDLVSKLRGRTVHFEPAEAGIAYAYPGIEWRPLPIFQTFAAYTAALDRTNADFLRSSQAPQLILRMPAPVDGRNPWFDSPEANVEMLCHYRQAVGSPLWHHVADRCPHPERPIAVVRAYPDDVVPVPAVRPGEVLLLRISGLNASVTERLEVLLWKADEWRIDMDGVVNRLMPGTAGQSLLLTPPISDGPATGLLVPPPDTVRLFSRPMLFGPSRPLITFAFSALPVDDP